jgi:hypothetical protein
VPLVGNAHLTLLIRKNPASKKYPLIFRMAITTLMSMNLALIIASSVILGLCIMNVINLSAPLSLTKETVNCIFDAGLTTSGMLIAVVGILLSIFISQNLKEKPAGSKIRSLIWALTISIAASFSMSIFALYLINYPGSEILTIILVNLFFAVIIVIVASIIGTVCNILK